MPECYDSGRTAIDPDDIPGVGRISLIELEGREEAQVWRPAKPSRELFMYRKILVVTFGTELSNKAVKEAAQRGGVSDCIEEIVVPTEGVVEVKKGKKVNTERKFFPGYVLIKMKIA